MAAIMIVRTPAGSGRPRDPGPDHLTPCALAPPTAVKISYTIGRDATRAIR